MKAKILYFTLTFVTTQVFGQFTAREYFKFGKSKFDDSKYFEAVDFLDKAIKLDPSYENALFLRAESFLALKKYKLAIGDYTSVIKNRKTYDSYTAEYFLKRAVAKMEIKDYRSKKERSS